MLKLVRLSEAYREQLGDMMDEWTATGETIVPCAIVKNDYRDFDRYLAQLEVKEAADGLVPDSVFFCLDDHTNRFVGAVNIRHRLNALLLRSGGHIGELTQKLYDTLTGIQWGKLPDTKGWIVPVE